MQYFIDRSAWEVIFSLLRNRNDIHAKNEEKTRVFIEAVWFVMRSGCQWRLLPPYYGKWRTVHHRFLVWVKKGVFDHIFQGVREKNGGEDAQEIMLDATIVRSHRCSAGYEMDGNERQALGRSKGGFTTKIHACVDALGNPLRFLLSGGQRNEITQAPLLVDGVCDAKALADKGYDSNAFVEKLKEQNCEVCIPPRKNRKERREYDEHDYKERHLIECFFGKIKEFRRIFSRFDKTAIAYMGFLCFASALIWLR